MKKKSAICTNSFLKITALILACAQTNLFAPKGGPCTSGGDTYTGRGECFSGFGSGHCAAPCMGDAVSYGTNGRDHGNGYSSGSQGCSDTLAQSNFGHAIPLSSQEKESFRAQISAECYVAPNGQICTKAQLIAAAQELATITTGLAQGRTNVAVSWVAKDIALRLFGIDTAQLGCAIAQKAPAKLCHTAARIKQLDLQIKRLRGIADTLQKDIDSRTPAFHGVDHQTLMKYSDSGAY